MNVTTDLEVREGVDRETVETVANMGSYKYGWDTEIEMDYAPKGLSEDIVRLISQKNEGARSLNYVWYAFCISTMNFSPFSPSQYTSKMSLRSV